MNSAVQQGLPTLDRDSSGAKACSVQEGAALLVSIQALFCSTDKPFSLMLRMGMVPSSHMKTAVAAFRQIKSLRMNCSAGSGFLRLQRGAFSQLAGEAKDCT